jgi:curved DNA-binding protein CbpA
VPAKDPYRVLGVSRGASEDEIRKSYRRLVREHHPDANPGDSGAEERFKEIQHAYEILSDPRKRREHDERSRPSSSTSSGRRRPRTRGRAGRRTVRADNLSDFSTSLANFLFSTRANTRSSAGSYGGRIWCASPDFWAYPWTVC